MTPNNEMVDPERQTISNRKILKNTHVCVNSGFGFFKEKHKINLMTLLLDILHFPILNKFLEIIRMNLWKNSVKSLNYKI